MSILSRALAWSRVAEVEAEILSKLRKAERIAGEGKSSQYIGVDIPIRGPHSELTAAALQRILAKHPDLAVTRFADHFTLARRQAFKSSMNSGLFDFLGEHGHMTAPGKGLER